MQPIPSTRRSHFSSVLRASLLLAAAAVFAACDRHSAEEVPENYGHGSSHERVTPDHQVDSKYPSKSFSDTAGTKDESAEAAPAAPAGSPSPTPAPRFF